MKLEGKAFIVTGGAGGIGGEVAKQIIAKGGIVVSFDRYPKEKGEEITKPYHPERSLYVQVDIADLASVERGAQETLSIIPKGSLFGAVHCAAIAPGTTWTNKLVDAVKRYEDVLRVNAYGTFVVNAVIADAMNSQYPDEGPFGPRVKEERGVIINTASAVAWPVPARCLTYGASKTAVLGISQGMADFLGPYGIRVNSISPAVVASGLMTPNRIPYFQKELAAGCIFPHRVTTLEEIGQAILFMMENSMVNDFELRVDGGWRGSSNWGAPEDPRQNALSLE
ncbi:3-hydroxyacyl-CoA dehydrogenase [Kwoniella mangroviensis CBS 10435]|uniref:3-hydroxyacyl-CoA dehydrogenase n=1 Tax=Kwoniella mangroviensis CBS 10435 TaxID=1331196 RepID=A0A1B9IZ58_9TREE|nr:3-hydroxyacyl-CoA dehydrogenase [Kwoniella mangroviensis CBS 8507]OCF60792.1 3-hydroxyacyl-CoA dehydrogenase [Kwoniella mangroviensis CBS 10435]OCF64518.1 3-hydroxyacyl-CoA dehydrogenase [Kwoniella mangroviensis CBS 8507]OCF74459.1 3-hydroxyacyl-CoA dehydrogenase [Kwoniella mangroviensis CBS 8886]